MELRAPSRNHPVLMVATGSTQPLGKVSKELLLGILSGLVFLRLSHNRLCGDTGDGCVCGCGRALVLFSLTGSASFTHSHQGNTPVLEVGPSLIGQARKAPPSDS